MRGSRPPVAALDTKVSSALPLEASLLCGSPGEPLCLAVPTSAPSVLPALTCARSPPLGDLGGPGPTLPAPTPLAPAPPAPAASRGGPGGPARGAGASATPSLPWHRLAPPSLPRRPSACRVAYAWSATSAPSGPGLARGRGLYAGPGEPARRRSGAPRGAGRGSAAAASTRRYRQPSTATRGGPGPPPPRSLHKRQRRRRRRGARLHRQNDGGGD